MDKVERRCRELEEVGTIVHMAEDDETEDDDDEHDDEEDDADEGLAQGVPEGRQVVHEREVLEDGDKRKEGAEGRGEQPVVLMVGKRFDVAVDALGVNVEFFNAQDNVPGNQSNH